MGKEGEQAEEKYHINLPLTCPLLGTWNEKYTRRNYKEAEWSRGPNQWAGRQGRKKYPGRAAEQKKDSKNMKIAYGNYRTTWNTVTLE